MRWTDPYLDAAMKQVRVKRIRGTLAAELRDHLELQKAAYMADGLSEAEAEKRAMRDMGDPVSIGSGLDAVHRPRTPWPGLFAALAAIAFGLAMRALFGVGPALLADTSRLILPLLAVCAIALLSLTDYTHWFAAAIPPGACLTLLVAVRLLRTCGFAPGALGPLLPLIGYVGPQVTTILLPVLLAMMASRLRGRGMSGFLPCFAPTVATALLLIAYRNTGFDPGPSALMLMFACGVLAFAVREGFFDIDRRFALIPIALAASAALWVLLHDLSRRLNLDQDYWREVVFPLIRGAKVFGSSFRLPLYREAGSLFLVNDAFSAFFPAALIIFLGWGPYALFTLALIAAIAATIRKVLPLENRMGRLIGFAAVGTLAIQVFIACLSVFARYPESLCMPLMSTGSAMQIADAAIVGMLLSVLRGADLPEGFRPARRIQASFSRISNHVRT